MPSAMRALMVIQCMVFFGIQTWNGFSQQWFTNSVYEGDEKAIDGTPAKMAYTDGQDAFAMGGLIRSGVQLVLSLFIMAVLAKTSIRAGFIYAPCLWVGAVASLLAAFAVGHSGTFAITCFVLTVVAETATSSVPYSLVAKWNQQAEAAGKPASTAMQMALLNCCITVGQQVTVLTLSGIQTKVSLEISLLIVIGISAVMYALAGIGAFFLKDCDHCSAPPCSTRAVHDAGRVAV
jgi:hypothetical protein